MKKHLLPIHFMVIFLLAGCMHHQNRTEKTTGEKQNEFFQNAGKKTDSLENIILERKKF